MPEANTPDVLVVVFVGGSHGPHVVASADLDHRAVVIVIVAVVIIVVELVVWEVVVC